MCTIEISWDPIRHYRHVQIIEILNQTMIFFQFLNILKLNNKYNK